MKNAKAIGLFTAGALVVSSAPAMAQSYYPPPPPPQPSVDQLALAAAQKALGTAPTKLGKLSKSGAFSGYVAKNKYKSSRLTISKSGAIPKFVFVGLNAKTQSITVFATLTTKKKGAKKSQKSNIKSAKLSLPALGAKSYSRKLTKTQRNRLKAASSYSLTVKVKVGSKTQSQTFKLKRAK